MTKSAMEIINSGGSYANVTKFDKAHAATLFDNHGGIVGTTLGPHTNPTLIQFTDEDMMNEGTAKDGVYATKDGYTVLNRIRHLNKFDQAVINTSFDTTKLNNDTSGDGTTTSYVFFAKLFASLYNNSYKHVTGEYKILNKRMTDGQFAKLLRKAISVLSNRIDEIHRTPITDYDELVNIARVSLNNDDENLKPLKSLLMMLKDMKIPASAVNISIANSNNSSSTVSINSGFEFSSKLYLRTSDILSLENTRFIVLERNLETHDQTNAVTNLIEATRKHYEETGETFVVAMNTINESYITYLESYYRNQEQVFGEENYKRHLFLVEFAETKGIAPSYYLQDMLIYFNSSLFNITEAEVNRSVDNTARLEFNNIMEDYKLNDPEKYAGIMESTDSFNALRKEIFDKYEAQTYADKIKNIIFKGGFGRLPKIRIDEATSVFMTVIKKDADENSVRNDEVLLARINDIRNTQTNTTSMNEKDMCSRRFMNLVQQYAVITIGAPTVTERETLYSANLDATLAVNSAAKIGIVSGMCIPTKMSAFEFADGDAYTSELEAILDKYEFTDKEKIVFKDVARDIYSASSFISEAILRNADMTDDEIDGFNKELQTRLMSITPENPKFEPIGYDVLELEWSKNIISPYESEKSYINAALLTCIPFITANLFIHPNQYFTGNVTSTKETPKEETAMDKLEDVAETVGTVVKRTTWLRRMLGMPFLFWNK